MHAGMSLTEMLTEVVRQSDTKRDFCADTKETIRMVPMPGFQHEVALVLASSSSNAIGMDSVPFLERFEITENCHKQIASRLQIPAKYYFRLLKDHRDLVLENVNTLFEREPEIRMIRTLDGKARAFLSQQYRRVDNDEILQATLPVIKNDYDTTMLASHVDENRMRVKCLFDGPSHTIDIGKTTRDGTPDTVQVGFEMGNSEVGGGSFYIRGFFYRGYCLNGCVWNSQETVTMRQIHVGSKLGIPAGFELSDETKRKEDELIISAAKDTLKQISSPEFNEKMAQRLRYLAQTKEVADPHAAVEAVCKEVGLGERDSKRALEAFISDRDYSQWGMVNAITNVANRVEEFERASEIEEMGAKIINLPANRWNQIASLEAEKVAA